jgi:hypothetical protein
MYAGIAINENNYKIKFDPESDENFSRSGGMFKIHTKESIESEITSERSFFAVIKNADKRIIASLWVSVADPSFHSFKPSVFGIDCKSLKKAFKEEKVAYPREIIVNPVSRYSGIADVLCYTVFYNARRNGQIWAAGEVYKLTGYRIGGFAKELCMLNNSGYKTITGMGGRFIKPFPLRDIHINLLTATIESQVFVLHIDKTLTVLEHSINNSGYTVCWENHNNEKY